MGRNNALHALLAKWGAAAEDANLSSQQARTFRRAATSVATHATEITCREEALRVKHVGDVIANNVADWLEFEAKKKTHSLRMVALLVHTEEEKWWSVHTCDSMALRSWGKRRDGQNRPGMDNWQRMADSSEALKWAIGRAKRQLSRGYAHASGFADAFAAAQADAQAPSSSSAQQLQDASPTHVAAASDAHRENADPDGSSSIATASKRPYQPKLTNPRSGDVCPTAALLIALHQAQAVASGDTPPGAAPARSLVTGELLARAQTLCPTAQLTFRAPLAAHGRGEGANGQPRNVGRAAPRGGSAGAATGALRTLQKHGLIELFKDGRMNRYTLAIQVQPHAHIAQRSGASIAAELNEEFVAKHRETELRATAATWTTSNPLSATRVEMERFEANHTTSVGGVCAQSYHPWREASAPIAGKTVPGDRERDEIERLGAPGCGAPFDAELQNTHGKSSSSGRWRGWGKDNHAEIIDITETPIRSRAESSSAHSLRAKPSLAEKQPDRSCPPKSAPDQGESADQTFMPFRSRWEDGEDDSDDSDEALFRLPQPVRNETDRDCGELPSDTNAHLYNDRHQATRPEPSAVVIDLSDSPASHPVPPTFGTFDAPFQHSDVGGLCGAQRQLSSPIRAAACHRHVQGAASREEGESPPWRKGTPHTSSDSEDDGNEDFLSRVNRHRKAKGAAALPGLPSLQTQQAVSPVLASPTKEVSKSGLQPNKAADEKERVSSPSAISPCIAQRKRKVRRKHGEHERIEILEDEDELQHTPSARSPSARKCNATRAELDEPKSSVFEHVAVAHGGAKLYDPEQAPSQGVQQKAIFQSQAMGVDMAAGNALDGGKAPERLRKSVLGRENFFASLPKEAQEGPLSKAFEICLIVDSREKLSRSELASTLCGLVQDAGLTACVKPLPVGDFLWIAVPRERGVQQVAQATSDISDCLVLDCIIERKQAADFLSTLKHSRHYNSQKVRLQRCGLRRKFYLVEGCIDRWHHVGERERMKAELCHIQMVDRLLVKRTSRIEETVQFLRKTTEYLERELMKSAETLRQACPSGFYSPPSLSVEGSLLTWNEFCAATSPPECISHAFGRMLLNIAGVNAPMVQNVLHRYPTPLSLVEAIDHHRRACTLRGLPALEGKWLLADILVPGCRRQRLSETITDFFCKSDLK
ncbi:hypothetical protein AB1Y20_022862 [Prymnesium parvum]|uniref:Crossover junction endonuclease MUS81 n=1 Tax=Prymnesium parvum TaxID=97485 RepID=A0AB34JCG3_PRYPA